MLFARGNRDAAPLTDEALIAAYRSTGDNSHVGELYKRYTHLALGVCMKYLHDEGAAADAAMEVFEKLLEELKKRDVQQFKPWLYTITKNHCLMKLRSRRTEAGRMNSYRRFASEIMEEGEAPHLYTGEDGDGLHERLEAALEKLKDEQRTCIHLYYFESKSYKEIEQITGMDGNQVKSYLQNAKRNLKGILTGNG